MEAVTYDERGVCETDTNGKIVFSTDWNDIQRVTFWLERDCNNDIEDIFCSIEITRQQTGPSGYSVYSEHKPILFEQWVDALVYWLPEFNRETIEEVLVESRSSYPTSKGLDVESRVDLVVNDWRKDADGSYLWHTPESSIQEGDLSDLDEPYYDWFDETYERLLEESLEEYSENARSAFRSLYLLHGDIQNGGLEQYLGNSTGNEALVAVDALRSISANSPASTLDNAIKGIWPDGYPENVEARRHRLEKCTTEEQNMISESDFQIATGWLSLLSVWMNSQARHQ